MSTTIDESAAFLDITIHGHRFEADLAEAADLLAAIDRKHAGDPWACRGCSSEFVPTDEALLAGSDEEPLRCPGCGRQDCIPPQSFLDDVKDLLVKRWGAPKCSRQGAGEFYTLVVDTTNSLKKTSMTPADSIFGTEEQPTIDDSPAPSSEPG